MLPGSTYHHRRRARIISHHFRPIIVHLNDYPIVVNPLLWDLPRISVEKLYSYSVKKFGLFIFFSIVAHTLPEMLLYFSEKFNGVSDARVNKGVFDDENKFDFGVELILTSSFQQYH